MSPYMGIAELKCDLCEEFFMYTSKLKHHMILHYDDRQYKCIQCDKTFSHSGSLLRHIRIHAGGETSFLQAM